MWLINYGERTSASTLDLGHFLFGPSRHVGAFYYYVYGSPALNFSAATYFAIKRSAPCSAVLCHSTSLSAAVVVYWSAVLRSPRALTFGYGCAVHVGVDVRAGDAEVDVIYITFIMSAQSTGYLVLYKDKIQTGNWTTDVVYTDTGF